MSKWATVNFDLDVIAQRQARLDLPDGRSLLDDQERSRRPYLNGRASGGRRGVILKCRFFSLTLEMGRGGGDTAGPRATIIFPLARHSYGASPGCRACTGANDEVRPSCYSAASFPDDGELRSGESPHEFGDPGGERCRPTRVAVKYVVLDSADLRMYESVMYNQASTNRGGEKDMRGSQRQPHNAAQRKETPEKTGQGRKEEDEEDSGKHQLLTKRALVIFLVISVSVFASIPSHHPLLSSSVSPCLLTLLLPRSSRSPYPSRTLLVFVTAYDHLLLCSNKAAGRGRERGEAGVWGEDGVEERKGRKNVEGGGGRLRGEEHEEDGDEENEVGEKGVNTITRKGKTRTQIDHASCRWVVDCSADSGVVPTLVSTPVRRRGRRRGDSHQNMKLTSRGQWHKCHGRVGLIGETKRNRESAQMVVVSGRVSPVPETKRMSEAYVPPMILLLTILSGRASRDHLQVALYVASSRRKLLSSKPLTSRGTPMRALEDSSWSAKVDFIILKRAWALCIEATDEDDESKRRRVHARGLMPLSLKYRNFGVTVLHESTHSRTSTSSSRPRATQQQQHQFSNQNSKLKLGLSSSNKPVRCSAATLQVAPKPSPTAVEEPLCSNKFNPPDGICYSKVSLVQLQILNFLHKLKIEIRTTILDFGATEIQTFTDLNLNFQHTPIPLQIQRSVEEEVYFARYEISSMQHRAEDKHPSSTPWPGGRGVVRMEKTHNKARDHTVFVTRRVRISFALWVTFTIDDNQRRPRHSIPYGSGNCLRRRKYFTYKWRELFTEAVAGTASCISWPLDDTDNHLSVCSSYSLDCMHKCRWLPSLFQPPTISFQPQVLTVGDTFNLNNSLANFTLTGVYDRMNGGTPVSTFSYFNNPFSDGCDISNMSIYYDGQFSPMVIITMTPFSAKLSAQINCDFPVTRLTMTWEGIVTNELGNQLRNNILDDLFTSITLDLLKMLITYLDVSEYSVIPACPDHSNPNTNSTCLRLQPSEFRATYFRLVSGNESVYYPSKDQTQSDDSLILPVPSIPGVAWDPADVSAIIQNMFQMAFHYLRLQMGVVHPNLIYASAELYNHSILPVAPLLVMFDPYLASVNRSRAAMANETYFAQMREIVHLYNTSDRVPVMEYSRTVPKLKPLGSAMTSVFVSTFAMLSTIWAIFSLIAGVLAKMYADRRENKREKESKYDAEARFGVEEQALIEHSRFLNDSASDTLQDEMELMKHRVKLLESYSLPKKANICPNRDIPRMSTSNQSAESRVASTNAQRSIEAYEASQKEGNDRELRRQTAAIFNLDVHQGDGIENEGLDVDSSEKRHAELEKEGERRSSTFDAITTYELPQTAGSHPSNLHYDQSSPDDQARNRRWTSGPAAGARSRHAPTPLLQRGFAGRKDVTSAHQLELWDASGGDPTNRVKFLRLQASRRVRHLDIDGNVGDTAGFKRRRMHIFARRT
ncbi:hypothetical protein R3P38DRAFT_3459982 [Favolaschia claudopus]|uniref:Transmembrane protein n=1 Tax=Favolaschia claudopus TaxID=2862362 RepID=A0AAV9ZI12_9AGAR